CLQCKAANPDPRTQPPQGPPNQRPPNQQPPYTGQQSPYGQTPPSPFGGACTTGYVCQGNTLYYQSTNSYGMGGLGSYGGGTGQCMTQPVQQCQFGCQQPYGATGA